jgi:hypothetical protein
MRQIFFGSLGGKNTPPNKKKTIGPTLYTDQGL